MKHELKKQVEAKFNIQTRLEVVKKNNGVELTALFIPCKDTTLCQTVYIDGLLNDLENGVQTMEDALSYLEVIMQHEVPSFDLSCLKEKDKLLANVVYSMVNYEMNQEILKNIPHKRWNDLAITFKVYVAFEEEEKAGNVLVNNDVLELTEVTFDELDKAAYENTKKLELSIASLGEILYGMGFQEDDLCPSLYVGSNKDKMYGSHIILYPELIQPLAEQKNSDIFIIPSSVHEVLLIAEDESFVESLKGMVAEVNKSSCVDDQEILSYQVYRYSKETGEILIA